MAQFRTIPKKAVTLTESDSTDIRGVGALYIGTAGDVHVRNMEGNVVIFLNAQSGQTIITGEIDRLMAATTAEDIIGYYVP
jgi:hypothetical protein